VEPLKALRDIRTIKSLLKNNPRNYCIFTLGVNLGLRGSDLLALQAGQVKGLKAGDDFEIRERKTGKKRRLTLNRASFEAIQQLLRSEPFKDDSPLFQSKRTKKPLTVQALNALVKRWTGMINLRGNYGSHSLRKTFGYHRHRLHGASLPQLMECFGHRTQRETLRYLCLQDREIRNVYMAEI
jgi:integrase